MSTLQISEEPSSTAPLSPHRLLQEFYATPAARSRFVNQLFDEAAPDYDWVSGAMSFGTDQAYRREALQRAGLRPGMRLLDVASGTGLMIKAALELGLSTGHITGLDPSLGMLEQNRRRNAVSLLQGRGERLPFRDATFDFLCMGYALRHVEDLRALFSEYRRILKPGGRLLILEITRPTNRVALGMMRLYMQKVVAALAWLRRRNATTAKLMKYYWATIAECVPPEAILSALQAADFRDARRITMRTILSEYVAQR
jgi:demethylmenaquinone methyltransferase/2-methoxy-6-polyprenyl-1,4-benzoquinol methylase